MTIQKLASAIAKREGKKSQARIGDIREILKIICTLEAEDCIKQDAAGRVDDQSNSPLYAVTEYSNKILDKLRAKRKRKKKPAFRGGSKKRA